MNMKKLFGMTIILLIVYVLIQISFKGLNHGHDISYEVSTDKKKFNIREKFIQNYNNEIDNYYIEITYKDTIFNIQTNHDFKKMNYIISDVYYYENEDYKCIYPIFKTNDVITDVLCENNKVIENYTNIKGKYQDIDSFVSNIKKYEENVFINEDNNIISKYSIDYYYSNNENRKLILENYKGLYIIEKEIKKIDLFDKDIYTKNISGFIDNYYIVANYNKEYDFNEVYLINLDNHKKTTLTRDKSISFDSIYQGIVDNKLYFIDTTNKEQYEISKNKITKYGDINSNIKVYYNNSWNEVSFKSAIENKTIMSDYSVNNNFNGIDYTKVDKVGNKLSGYYYIYESIDNGYKVYRANIQNKDIRKYLFTTTNINNIVYLEDSVYYINKDSIYKYNDYSGNKLVLKTSELEFNNNIKFTVK